MRFRPSNAGVAGFQAGDDPQRLRVVIEAAERLHGEVQPVLPGMAEGGVAEVVRQGERFREIFIEAEFAGDGAGDLGDFDAVGEARAEEIADVVDENLCFVLELAEGGAVDDAVAVALPGAARGGFGLRVQAAAGGCGLDGVGGEGHGRVV